MKKNNIEKIKDFLSLNEDATLLVNQVNEEIYCFYSYVIREFSNKFDLKINKDVSYNENNFSNDLFGDKSVNIHNLNNIKHIEEIGKKDFKKIIFTDYRAYKKLFNKYTTINGYDFEKDLKIFFNNYCNINDEELISYCISKPYFTFSEVSKYNVNKSNYLTDPMQKDADNFILQVRKEIFMSKKSNINIKELFYKLKKEVMYKKFSFLAY